MRESMSFVRRVSQIGTLVQTWLCGVRVGSDADGNCYYRERHVPDGRSERRWVLYSGMPEASAVPPEWHCWLHHITRDPLAGDRRARWQKPHEANQSGTAAAHYPPGHILGTGIRQAATGDYVAWKPEAGR